MKRFWFKGLIGILTVAGLGLAALLSPARAGAFQQASTPAGILVTVIYAEPINVRSGPSTVFYPIIGQLQPGDVVPASGVSPGRDWVQISFAGGANGVGWIYAAFVTISGGELQMLAIGRALMGNPRVLLLDEPSEGLAPLIVAEVGRTIHRLKEEGQSIVLVEQNLKLALEVADQAVILNTGRCVFDGSAAELSSNDAIISQNLGIFHAH